MKNHHNHRNQKSLRSSKLLLLCIGIASTVWFLIRVIPKPSRAAYPCMRTAVPFMSAFMVYLISLGTTVFAIKKYKHYFTSAKYLTGSVFLLVALISFSLCFFRDSRESKAGTSIIWDAAFPVPSNAPVGEAKGLFPGRVVWVHDPDATNEDYDPATAGDELWYSPLNTDQDAVGKMLSAALLQYAGKKDISEAWEAVFTSFNSSHGRGERGYTPGEKIAIKINLTNQCCVSAERMDATPQLLNAILQELTTNAGVKESDIILGDPYRDFRAEYVDLVMSAFPDVNYRDRKGGNGIMQTIPSADEVLVFSDKELKSTLPQYYLDAAYHINIPCLKTHKGGGMTLIAKNHFGSFLEKGSDPASQSASAAHYSLPSSVPGRQKYRNLVDFLGHEHTGGKGLLYIIDGSVLESLGVFEHWNNATERKYSRNLGTGEGIELHYLRL